MVHRDVYFSAFPPQREEGGGGKNIEFGVVGKKYNDSIRKKKVKKGGKKIRKKRKNGNFYYTWGKYNLEKNGRGAKISGFGIILQSC